MTQELWVLVALAASIGFFHTLFGPDHYLPFIMMSRARGWSRRKTALITFLCGLGHVLSSVVLGLIGVAAGIAVGRLEALESVRGDLAAWALIAFGLVYFAWGLRRAVRNRPHIHAHVHDEGGEHEHEHVHAEGHAHVHAEPGKANITPWVLFTIFVLGPCEPLIPVLMYPAAKQSIWGMALAASVFSAITIGTMMSVVLVATLGLNLNVMRRLFSPMERYMHAVAGGIVCASGLAIQFLGL
ncbi:MAG: sulfite exporter TauE/SafE family protein [Planctomycetota bacterium]